MKTNLDPSVMVLVKNESYFLPYVLAQTIGYFTSYVIYDVGSTDNTREIIDWFTGKMDGRADLYVRYLPHVPREVQGTFRNSMIVEGDRPSYFILDGDELYTPEDMRKVLQAAADLQMKNSANPLKRYGVFKRIEVTEDLTQRYVKERSHHRLYTADAFWTGTHPGEVPAYKQNEFSETYYPIRCWHMHNTLRSPKEEDALLRVSRKQKRTYHPGDETSAFDLLAELPVLRKPIENFPVSPALAALQAQHRAS